MIPGNPAPRPQILKALDAYPELKWEELGRNDLKIAQLPDSFRFGEEQILLAHWAADLLTPTMRLQSARGDRPVKIVDPGAGSGILSLMLSALIPGCRGLALEIMDRPYALLQANLLSNGLMPQFQAVQGDLRQLAQTGIPDDLWPGQADLVIANPPYFAAGTGPDRAEGTPGAKEIAVAREERLVNLDEYISCCARWLAPQGSLAILHRPDRLADVILACDRYGLRVSRLRALVPHEGEKPQAFFLAAKKQGKSQLRWQRDLVIRLADGRYTPEVQAFYEETTND